MKPYFKYSGGKTREMKRISPYIPADTKRIVEPFCGSASVSIAAELPSLIADIDTDVINLHTVVSKADTFKDLMKLVAATNVADIEVDREKNVKHLERLYYELRDDHFSTKDPILKAYRFLVLRQLCFSGMTRFNSKTGKSNVPFGWYPHFKTRLDDSYHRLLSTWEIKLQEFEVTLAQVKTGDWVFLDPPYFDRNSSYEVSSDAGTSELMHTRIREILKGFTERDIPWLMVHSDCELYRDIYSGCDISQEKMFYSQNFKGAGISNARVGHLYITANSSTGAKIVLPPLVKQKKPKKAAKVRPIKARRKIPARQEKLSRLIKVDDGGWAVHTKYYGSGKKIVSVQNGTRYEADHDMIFDHVEASLKAKGKPSLFDKPRQFGAGSGLRGFKQGLWKEVRS